MDNEHDRFWQGLRAKVNPATPADPTADISMEEAERRMASAGEDPLSDQQIDAMVRSATGEKPGLRVVKSADEPVAVKPNFLRRHSGWTKVAAVFLGMAMLYSVGDFMVAPGTVAPTIAFDPDALAIDQGRFLNSVDELLDAQTPDQQRVNAQTQVFAFARASITALQEAQAAGEQLALDAELHLGALLDELVSEEVVDVEGLIPLLGNLPSSGSSLAETRAYLEAVRNQARYGIQILKAVRTEDEDARLNTSRAAWLRILRKAIDP